MSNVVEVDFKEVMEFSYNDYSQEVIKERALPDTRDGLKLGARRALWAMSELNLVPSGSYKKSARIVGEILGKYHPHGDSSAYDTIVKMAQDWYMRYPLVDGHGNWGSIDGDSPAAMRYTEAKQSQMFSLLLQDIKKDTVDFIPNFDGEEIEPVILPSRYPNLLVNGAFGIAVGFATNIPPHNLKNAIDTVIYQLDNPNCTASELTSIIQAPDFPTGGIIMNPKDLPKIYEDGEGKIIVRGKYHLERDEKQDKDIIVFTEIPYHNQITKAKIIDCLFLISKDQKTKDKDGKDKVIKAKIPEIDSVTDESDREGMRIAIKLKKRTNINSAIAKIFKFSDLQFNYCVNMTVIHKRELLEHISLKDINKYYIEHQKEVLTRRSQYELNKANERLHIVVGLKKALENLDKTIEIIKSSNTKALAKEMLCKELKIDNIQAQEILNIKLSQMVRLEINTFINEYNELLSAIKRLENILSSEENLLDLFKTELLEIKEKYGDERRTCIEFQESKIHTEIVIETEDYNMKYFLTKGQYLKKIPLVNLRNATENKIKEDDYFITELQSTNNSELILLSNLGNAYKMYGNDLDDTTTKKLGEYIPSLIELEPNEKIVGMLSTSDFKGYCIVVFENGKIAKINLNSFQTQTKRTKLKNSLNLDSPVVSIFQIAEDTDLLLKSNQNKAVIVNTKDVTEKSSRNSQGVTFMKSYREDFKVVSAELYKGDLDDSYRTVKALAGKYI